MTPTNLLGLSEGELALFVNKHDEQGFRATQLVKWIHQAGIDKFDNMTNLSKTLRERLCSIAIVEGPSVIDHRISSDGTHKWLFRIDQSNSVETVYIPEPDRGTLCVSSQVGCPLNCDFCATAKQGFNRNLTSSEIIGQLWQVMRIAKKYSLPAKISNIVMMGMGEPLLNFDNVISAMRLMIADNAYGLAQRRVTLSTAGIAPGIVKLKSSCPVSLAVSLHAPTNELRDELVPINKTYPIEVLFDACREYLAGQARAVITFEYVMLKGVNDSPALARALAKLIRDLPAKVNLIPFNPFPGIQYRRSSDETINNFRDILVRAGIITLTRKTRGDDINAACGQLAGRVQPRAHRITVRRGLTKSRNSPNH